MITVGMNYKVIEGKGQEFEAVFNKVLGIMNGMEGHKESHLYCDTNESNEYLIVSEWNDRAAFDGFIASERFKNVTDWGKSEVLAARPKHEIYETPQPATAAAPEGAGCPMHND